MRRFIPIYVLPFAILLSVARPGRADPGVQGYLLFVGTYTESASKGIYVFRFDAASGQLSWLGLAAETRNPSFLAADAARGLLYAVNELREYQGAASGAVTAFSIDRSSGKLSRLNEVASRGADPCYIALDKTGNYALVANYTGGSVAVFPVLKDGRLAEASAFMQNAGHGPNEKRQEGPHAHWIETTADNRFAIAADLGLDQLLIYRFDPTHGSLTANAPPAASLPPGAGPRHVAFSPDEKFAYAINELQSTVTVLAYDAGRGLLNALQTISTLPQGFAGENTAAEIRVDASGKFLYASNRGHDSIALFSIEKNSGRLTAKGHFPTGGKTPRNFVLDPTGSRLLVANQDSGTVVVFRIDPASGQLTRTQAIAKVASPVCLVFVPLT